jgi:hypothetical protein
MLAQRTDGDGESESSTQIDPRFKRQHYPGDALLCWGRAAVTVRSLRGSVSAARSTAHAHCRRCFQPHISLMISSVVESFWSDEAHRV